MWDEILWLRQCVTVSQSSCSCILQTRFKMLLAISQMQVRVGQGEERALGGGALWTRLPWEQQVDVLHRGKPQALPVLPVAQSATGLGAPALSSPAGPWLWGDEVSGFVVDSCGWAGGSQWVLCGAGWFPAGSCQSRPSCPDPPSAVPQGCPLTLCFLLPFSSHCAGAAGDPGPWAGLL